MSFNYGVVRDKLINRKYNEIEVKDNLIQLGCKVVEVGEIKKLSLKRFKLLVNLHSRFTLFIKLDEYDYIRDIVIDIEHRNRPYKATRLLAMTAGIVVLISLVLYLSIWGFNKISDIFNDFDTRPVDTINPDDKDGDGDVDLQDGIKYLEDSLEEDKYDGDDW